MLPLLLVATAAAVGAGIAGGTGLLRVTTFVVLLLGVAAALAADADARAERRELLAERARMSAAFADAHERLVRAHADQTDEVTARLGGHLQHLRERLSAVNVMLAAGRTELVAGRAELAAMAGELVAVRDELARVTRARDALKADVDAYVGVETARLAREELAAADAVHVDVARAEAVRVDVGPGGAVVDLGTWGRRAAG